jgi:hypothetical protein
MPNNLMNRFGGPRQAAPLAPMQQRKPGMLEQQANSMANKQMNSFMSDSSGYTDDIGLGGVKDTISHSFGADAATQGMASAVGEGAATGLGSQAQMLAAQNAGLGAEAATMTAEALGAGTAATEAAALGAAEAGLAGGAGAGAAGMSALGAAMPWVGAGLLAGKAFGLFSEGGPVNYKMCGGKAKYRAEGGRSDEDDYRAAAEFYSKYYDRSNKPKYDNSPYYIGTPKTYLNELPRMDEKQIMTPAEYRAGGGPLGLMAINKYHDKLQNDPLALSPAAALFRAEGSDEPESGGFWNYFKKSFTEKPAWEDYKAVQVPVLDGDGNPTNMTSTVYRPNPNAAPVAKRQPAPVEDRSVNFDKQIARDIYGEYDDGEDMGDASYLAGDPAPYSVQTYPLDRRGEISMKSNMPSKGGPLLRKFGAAGIRRNPEEFNRDLNEYSINRNSRLNPQPDDGSGIWEDMKGFFKSMGSSNNDNADVSNFNMGGRVGPLKSVKYKSAGGNVSEQSYYNPYGK